MNGIKRFNLSGIEIEIPVKYPKLEAYMVLFPISIQSAKKIINKSLFTPVAINFKQSLLAVTVFDYQECPVGQYRELAFSIPVIPHNKFLPPLIPFVFDYLFPQLGYFILLLMINTPLGIEHSRKIFGYPTYHNCINTTIKSENGRIKIDSTEQDKKILTLNLTALKEGKQENKVYNTYLVKDDRVYLIKMETEAVVSKSYFNNKDTIEFGEHEFSQSIRDLNISNTPLVSVQYNRAMEILHFPLPMSD